MVFPDEQLPKQYRNSFNPDVLAYDNTGRNSLNYLIFSNQCEGDYVFAKLGNIYRTNSATNRRVSDMELKMAISLNSLRDYNWNSEIRYAVGSGDIYHTKSARLENGWSNSHWEYPAYKTKTGLKAILSGDIGFTSEYLSDGIWRNQLLYAAVIRADKFGDYRMRNTFHAKIDFNSCVTYWINEDFFNKKIESLISFYPKWKKIFFNQLIQQGYKIELVKHEQFELLTKKINVDVIPSTFEEIIERKNEVRETVKINLILAHKPLIMEHLQDVEHDYLAEFMQRNFRDFEVGELHQVLASHEQTDILNEPQPEPAIDEQLDGDLFERADNHSRNELLAREQQIMQDVAARRNEVDIQSQAQAAEALLQAVQQIRAHMDTINGVPAEIVTTQRVGLVEESNNGLLTQMRQYLATAPEILPSTTEAPQIERLDVSQDDVEDIVNNRIDFTEESQIRDFSDMRAISENDAIAMNRYESLMRRRAEIRAQQPNPFEVSSPHVDQRQVVIDTIPEHLLPQQEGIVNLSTEQNVAGNGFTLLNQEDDLLREALEFENQLNQVIENGDQSTTNSDNNQDSTLLGGDSVEREEESEIL